MFTSETEPGPGAPPGAPADERFLVSQDNTDARIALPGDLDLPAVEALHTLLLALAGAGKDIAIDCKSAEHVPASALQILLAAQEALASRQHRLRIESESAAVRDYLKLAGLDERFPAAKAGSPGKKKKSSQVSPQP